MERIYYKLPVFMQNCIFSIYGWHLSRERYNRHFYKHLDRLKEMEYWTSEQIENYQDMKISSLIKHAYNTVPFYRKWYDKEGINIEGIRSASDLKYLPILTKEMVEENQHEMISTSFSRRSLIQAATSGTTGTPLKIYYTPSGLAYQWALGWRHKNRFGLKLKDPYLMFGARVPVSQAQDHPPYWRVDYANKRVYLSQYHVSMKTIGDILDYLNKNQFEFFTGLPSAIYVFASLIEEYGLQLHNKPKYVVSASETLSLDKQSFISRVLEAPVTEMYGMTEFAGNMSKCEHGRFHVDFECCYIENKPIPDSDNHSLILTGWGNPAMPFIRYEIGDFGRSLKQHCECGRNSISYAGIEGRLIDYVLTPDGRKITGFSPIFAKASNAREIQIYQKNCNEIEFRVISKRGFGINDKKAIIQEFQKRGGKNMNIKFRIVKELERSPTGKVRIVISDITREENSLRLARFHDLHG